MSNAVSNAFLMLRIYLHIHLHLVNSNSVPIRQHSPFFHPQAPGNPTLLSVPMNVTALGASSKWNQIVLVLLCLADFAQPNVLEAHLCSSVGENFLPF